MSLALAFATSNVVLLSIRFWTVGIALGLRLDISTATRATVIGNVAGHVLPGVLWGDLAKIASVGGRQGAPAASDGVVPVIVDRALGLGGLLLLGAWCAAMRPEGIDALVLPIPRQWSGFIALATLFAVGLAGLWVVMRIGKIVHPTWRHEPLPLTSLVAALGLAVATSASFLCIFGYVAHLVLGRTVDIFDLGVAFTVGSLSMLLPVSPAGIGVGHLTYDYVFARFGYDGGADVVNVYLIAKVAVDILAYACLCGIKARRRLHRFDGAGGEITSVARGESK